MKRLMLGTAAAVALLAVAGCDKKTETTTTTATDTAAPPTVPAPDAAPAAAPDAAAPTATEGATAPASGAADTSGTAGDLHNPDPTMSSSTATKPKPN